MRLEIEAMLDYYIEGTADILLQVEVAAMTDQRLEAQDLRVHAVDALIAVPGEEAVGQRCWARGQGPFRADYHAIVSIDRPVVSLAGLRPTPPRFLPSLVIPYLMPSRYCESEKFESFVHSEFAGLEGGALGAALVDWVRSTLVYASGSSAGATTAIDTFVERRGVCRDYAHLVVALARAGGIPARCVSAYAPGVDPPDFHAVAEFWFEGGWHLVDATGMADCQQLARVAVGRDATDIAFMTVFGAATLHAQTVSVRRIAD
jgi:transglutaminase-like putative cysteine protease